jgi:hypothetical protein
MKPGDPLYLTPANPKGGAPLVVAFVITSIDQKSMTASADDPLPGVKYIRSGIGVTATESGGFIKTGDCIRFYIKIPVFAANREKSYDAPYTRVIGENPRATGIAEGMFERAWFFESRQDAERFSTRSVAVSPKPGEGTKIRHRKG